MLRIYPIMALLIATLAYPALAAPKKNPTFTECVVRADVEADVYKYVDRMIQKNGDDSMEDPASSRREHLKNMLMDEIEAFYWVIDRPEDCPPHMRVFPLGDQSK